MEYSDPVMDDFTLGQARPKKRIPLARAEKLAFRIAASVEPLTDFIMITGSIRRRRPETADIDFVVLPRNLEKFLEAMEEMGFHGSERKRTGFVEGVKIEFYVAHRPEELGAMVFYATGDFLHNIAMRSIAKRRGWKLDQYGLFDAKTQDPILQSPYEEDFYGALGVDYHAPEERNFTTRSKGKKKASMGALGPRDWSPRRQVPGHEVKYPKALKDINWEGEEWRDPDVRIGHEWIWYGPGGQEGDYATTIEESGGGWDVSEYGRLHDQQEPNIQKTTTFVPYDLLIDALYLSLGIPIDREAIEEDPDEWNKYAVGLGVDYLGYYGGSEEWVDELP